MRGMRVLRVLLWAITAASPGWGQPTISSLQSSLPGSSPANVTGITSSTTVPGGGFILYVNSAIGDFNPNAFQNVTWNGTPLSPPPSTELTPNQITVFVPNSLFQTPVANPVAVSIVVHEVGRTSNSATFTINPPLQVLGPILPGGTVNAPYSAGFTSGGTPPFLESGGDPLPPGLAAQLPSATITGTPTQTGVFNFQVFALDFWESSVLGPATIEIVDVPTLTSLSPNNALAGSAGLTVTVNGTNFVGPVTVGTEPPLQQIPGSQVQWKAGNVVTPLATTFVNSTQLTAVVPASLLLTAGVAGVTVVQPGNASSNALPFTVFSSLAITTTSLPPGNLGGSYSALVTGKGGTLPYTWTASGFPPALFMNPGTGAISGTLLAGGNYLVTVVLRDAANSTATAQLTLMVGPPPVSIAPSSNLPTGTVGVAYTGFIFANGGTGAYTFSLGGGSLPDGLTLSSAGFVSGTPKTPGRFSFSVVVTDSSAATALGGFTITILPAPLNITGGPGGPVPTGTPIAIAFGGTGGVPPYNLSVGGTPPPGTAFGGGTLSGTPNTVGAFTFSITLTDSTSAFVTKPFTLTITAPPPPPALSLSGSLSDGKVGVPYTGQISPSGGTAPYTFAGSGLPDGLSLSLSGGISGTPGTAGKFSLTATATDSNGVTGKGTFGITIAPADLTIVTASLPDGVVGVAYSAGLTASGGLPPYTWTVSGLPDGVTAASPAISGTPATAGKFTVNVTVKDSAQGSMAQSKSYSLTIAPAPLTITTASAPNGTVGTAYSASFAASGGVPPYTFSATGLPAGLSMSTAGALTGTPTAVGATAIAVMVKDAAGSSASTRFGLNIVLPATPPLNYTGVSPTAGPLQQPRLQVSLGNAYPVDVVVTLTLTFVPDSGAGDPAIQFSTGGSLTRITVPAGATNGATDVGIQTGSVAGVITVTAQMQAGGQDVTPSPAPRTTIRIAAGAPVITTITAVRNATGFTVTVAGYVTDREMTQAIFAFTAPPGSNLQTTTLTVPADTQFAQYFAGTSAAPFGGQFLFTQPFTVTGSTQAIVSVTVTLVNKIGQSTTATAALN
jgi:hypothetical protein